MSITWSIIFEKSFFFNHGRQISYDFTNRTKTPYKTKQHWWRYTQLGKSFKFDTYKVRIVTNGGPPIKHRALHRIFVKTAEVIAQKSFYGPFITAYLVVEKAVATKSFPRVSLLLFRGHVGLDTTRASPHRGCVHLFGCSRNRGEGSTRVVPAAATAVVLLEEVLICMQIPHT